MVTVAELMKVLKKVKNPSETVVFLMEVDENGEEIKNKHSNVTFLEAWVTEKSICDCDDGELCGCVTDDLLNIVYR